MAGGQPPNNPGMMGNYNAGQQGYGSGQAIAGMQAPQQYSGFQQNNQMYNMANRNYKTVPCKYFHR